MNVLIVDPYPESRDALRRAFAEAGDSVRSVATSADGSRLLAEFRPDVVVAAFEGSDAAAAAFLELSRGSDPRRATYALIEGSRLEQGVAAMERGAHDFLWRPVSAGRVALLRSRFCARREREAGVEEMRLRLARAEIATSLAGQSALWKTTIASIQREAGIEAPVLLTGEEGTEKEPAARALHRLSRRGSEPFWNASEEGTIPAEGPEWGTLFIPAIEHAPLSRQRALLTELDDSRRRVIVAANRDPQEAIRSGRLLPELFDSLRHHVVHLPPLRERGEDVALLARRFLSEIDSSLYFDVEAMDALSAHDWPGNVEELRQVVFRASRLVDRPAIGPTVVLSVLAEPMATRRPRRKKPPVVRVAVGASLADVERRVIQKTLEFVRGNKPKAAQLLKLSLKTIYNKIKEYGLEPRA